MFRRCVWPRLLLILCVLRAAGSTTSRDLSVQPEKWRGNNYLLCRLASYEGGDLLSFSWVRLDANSTRHILTAVTRENFHRVPLGQHFRVGDQVICEVRPALAVGHPPPRPLRSPPTRLGVTWNSRQTRDGRTDLTLSVSAPVTCRPRQNCRLLLRLQPLQKGTAGTQLLLLDKCVVSFNCPGGICWPEIVTATISRAPHDGPPRPITAELRVILENRADLGPEWAEYQPPVIVLRVRPSTPLICQLIDGRHVVGFDARLRTLRRAGQHVLLAGRNDGGRTQVTVSTVTTRCGGRIGHSFCACAVTVDAGSEWIEVDVCSNPVDRREPTLRRSAPAGRGLQLHVLETRPDSAWLITSGSGLVVRLHAFPVDQDRSEDESPASRRRALSVTISVRSHGQSETGLCSGAPAEHFTAGRRGHRRNKRSLPAQDHLEELPFEELTDHLFSGALEPETISETPPEPTPDSPPKSVPETPAGAPEQTSQTEKQHTTDGKLKTMAGSAAGPTLETRPDIYPIPGILPDDTPYFTPDTQIGTQLERAKAEVQSSRVVGIGYESNAVFGEEPEPLLPTERRRHNCEHFIAKARQQSACAAQIDKAVMVALRDVCRLDASRSVERWAELLPPLLEDRCQVAALSQSPAEQGGLQCAENCAGGGCIQQGETVVNDHRPNEWVPQVTSVGHQGLCDLASAACVAISIQGRHLWPSVGLRCRVRQDDQAWSVAPATYRSAEEVQCHLPAASVRKLRHTADVVPWTIQVSYNGVRWSDAVVLKTYNSDCQICRERNGSVSCAPVIDSCIINGQCYRSGDTNPKNPCRYCGSNRHQWVTRVDDDCRGGRPVTCQTVGPACQHGLCVEDSRGAICVCHPGYIGTRCQIRETPPDFITLAEEMGDEALYAPREALDFRYR